MSKVNKLTSIERIQKAISCEPQDRPPLLLLFSYWGAKYNNMSVKDYFNSPLIVGRTQIELQKKFGHDCYYVSYYAALEIELMGGCAEFRDTFAPVVEKPIIRTIADLEKLKIPDFNAHLSAKKMNETIKYIKENGDKTVPIIGVVLSPFSIPIMQLGFSKYLDLFLNDQEFLGKLYQYNIKFSTAWAQFLVNSGVDILLYFNPFASRSISTREMYESFGYEIDKAIRANIKIPLIYHTASASSLELFSSIIDIGFNGCCISNDEDISYATRLAKGKMLIAGNLNGLEMVNNEISLIRDNVQEILKAYNDFGNIIVSDNHGEILWGTSEQMIISLLEEISAYEY